MGRSRPVTPKVTTAVATEVTEVMVVMEVVVKEAATVDVVKAVAVVQCVLPMANDPVVHTVAHMVAVVILLMNINNKVDMEVMVVVAAARPDMEVNNRVVVLHINREMATLTKTAAVPVATEAMAEAINNIKNTNNVNFFCSAVLCRSSLLAAANCVYARVLILLI